jgi:hypothetical protein
MDVFILALIVELPDTQKAVKASVEMSKLTGIGYTNKIRKGQTQSHQTGYCQLRALFLPNPALNGNLLLNTIHERKLTREI